MWGGGGEEGSGSGVNDMYFLLNTELQQRVTVTI